MVANQEAILSGVECAAIDGRMRTLRFRQRQFQSLFKLLTIHREELVAATLSDDNCSVEEAQLSYAATLLEIRNHYDALDLAQDMEIEYRLAKGKSNEARRVPIEIAYIIPDTLGTFFSVLSALSAALCAGCCIVVELQNTVQKTPALLKSYLTESLDKDAFCAIGFRASAEFLSKCVIVDPARRLQSSKISTTSKCLSSSLKQNIAVVDRNSDVQLASEEIVTSKLAFGGQSRYAVDLVLVNEFQAEGLISALTKALKKHQRADTIHVRSSVPKVGASSSAMVKEEVDNKRAKCLWKDSTNKIVEVIDRRSILLRESVPPTTTIVVMQVTSLDDSIDLLQCKTMKPSISALYLFASPREAKYLSQYISSEATFVNHIPSQLLVGPVCPEGYPVSLYKRYSTEMFKYPSPQFSTSSRTHPASKVLSNPARVAALVNLAQKPLKPTGQPPAGAWGFFEQGMVIGTFVYLLPIFSISLFGIGYGCLYSYRRIFPS